MFVPGDRPERFDKGLASGADALVLDLEDGVAPIAKAVARENIAKWLPGRPRTVPVLVRPTVAAAPSADLMAAATADGVMLPKVESTLDLARYAGWDEVVVMVESAAGLLAAPALAAHPATTRLLIGEYDLAADLGAGTGPGDDFMDPIRWQITVASAAAGIAPPIAAVHSDYRDLDGLAADTARLARMGFGSRAIIHPAQIEPVHRVLTPSTEEVERAREMVERFDAALAAGQGAIVDADGRMADEATVRSARRILARVGQLPGTPADQEVPT